MRWNFILNPQAGGGKAQRFWQLLQPRLGQLTIEHTYHFSLYPGHSKVLARQLAQQGERAFVAVGGDGSINELLQGLFDSNVPLSDFILAVAPQGTGNDWARYHKIPSQLDEWLAFFLRRNVVKHDLGLVKHGENFALRHVFINMAGCGLDCHILQQMGCANGKSFRYYAMLLKSLHAYPGLPLQVRWESESIERTVLLSMFCIGRYGGAGMDFSPHADYQSGKIQLVSIGDMAFLKRLQSLPYLVNGKIAQHSAVMTRGVDKVSVQSDEQVRFQCDGELVGYLPIEIHVQPHAIFLLSNLKV
ncbi:diacylglycerol/lipid kinase family protein [Vibrio navarrensis]|uniref:diacylglycerol/lipid kinase family protein n=1 Tax=Vibrio navarrensis TaxID=29495 RepID=UPI0018DE1AC0|nr:diacylglycerol kinase family protein [Vibrio navarrensis]MBH9738796.1 hypothetical protein [Vibrio navarrensis]